MLSQSEHKLLTNISVYRHKLVLLLAKTGKIEQAMNVITLPGSVELDRDVLTKTKPKGEFLLMLFLTDKFSQKHRSGLA